MHHLIATAHHAPQSLLHQAGLTHVNSAQGIWLAIAAVLIVIALFRGSARSGAR